MVEAGQLIDDGTFELLGPKACDNQRLPRGLPAYGGCEAQTLNQQATLGVGVFEPAGSRGFARLSALGRERDDDAGTAAGNASRSAAGNAGPSLRGLNEQQLGQ